MAAGTIARAVIQFAVNGARASLRAIQNLGDNFANLTSNIAEMGQKLFFIQEVFSLIANAGRGAYQAIIGANEELNASLLKSQTVLAQNLQVFDANGIAIDNISAKISSFGDALRENRKQLELNTKELVGVTSAFTFGVLDNVLLQFQNLNGQTKEFNSDLEGATELASNLTAALSSLNLTNDIQATQEVRALLSGDVNNPGATLAKTIGLSKDEFLRAKASGELIDVLNEKLKPFREGNALGALTIANEVSNITDAIEVFARTIGEGVGEDVAVVLNKYRVALEEALANPELLNKGSKLVNLIADTATSALEAAVALGKWFDQIGAFQGAFDVFTTAVAGFKALAENISAAAEAATAFANKLDEIADTIANTPVLGDIFKRDDAENIGAFAKAANLVRDPIAVFNGDLARSIELVEIQKRTFATASSSLGKYSDLVDKAADNTKKFEASLEKSGAKDLLDGLSEFDPTAVGPEEKRIQDVTKLRTVLQSLNLENEKQVLETLEKLATEEQNATLDNFKLRQRLSKQLQVQVASGTDLQQLKPQINAEIAAIEELIEANERQRLAGGKNRQEAEKLNEALREQIKLLKEQAKVAGIDLDASDGFSAANELREAGTAAEQALSDYESAIAGFKGATQEGLAPAADELVAKTTEAFKRGVIDQETAVKTLQDLAKSTKLTNDQRAKSEQALTNIIKGTSEVRQAAIKAEIAAIKEAEASGQISGSEARLQNQQKQIEQAMLGIKDLQAELDLAVALADGVETKQIQILRQQIAENVSNLAGLEAEKIVIAYENGLKDIERAEAEFDRMVAAQKAANQIAITELEASGQTSGDQTAINRQIADLTLLEDQIRSTKTSISELNQLQAGADQTSQRENRIRLEQEQNKLLQQKADLLRGELELEKSLNQEFIAQQQLAIERRNQAQELTRAENELELASANITEEKRAELQQVQQLKNTVQSRISLEQELSLVLQRQTTTFDEEQEKAREVHRLRVAILNAKQQEVTTSKQIGMTEQQAIDASAQAMKQRFSNAQQLLGTIQQQAAEASQELSKALSERSQGIGDEIGKLNQIKSLRQQIASATQAGDTDRAEFLQEQLRALSKEFNTNKFALNVGDDRKIALEIDKMILEKQKEQKKVQEEQKAAQEAQQAEQQAFAAQQQAISQQIANIEIEASVIKLENQKEALSLKKEELRVQGLLSDSIESSIDRQIANTEELIDINRDQGRIQNIGTKDSKERARKALKEAGINPDRFAREKLSTRGTLQTVEAGRALSQAQVDRRTKQVGENGQTQTLEQAIVGAIKQGFEGTPDASGNNADNSQKVVVNNNFANLSDERAMRRTIGL